MGLLCQPEVRPQGTAVFIIDSKHQRFEKDTIRHPEKKTSRGNSLGAFTPFEFQIFFDLDKSLLPQELADPIDQAMCAGVACCRPTLITIPVHEACGTISNHYR